MELDGKTLKRDNVNTPTKVVAPAKQEYKMVGSLRYRKGLTLFYFNLKTGAWGKVLLKQQNVITIGDNRKRKGVSYRAQYNPDAIYVYALNEENFRRKIEKILKIKLTKDGGAKEI